jgi:hypothetical protein
MKSTLFSVPGTRAAYLCALLAGAIAACKDSPAPAPAPALAPGAPPAPAAERRPAPAPPKPLSAAFFGPRVVPPGDLAKLHEGMTRAEAERLRSSQQGPWRSPRARLRM